MMRMFGAGLAAAMGLILSVGCSGESGDSGGRKDPPVDLGVNLSGDPPSITGTTYYVDPDDGDDGNSGTSEDDAWATLANVQGGFGGPGAGAGGLAAGDGVLFKAGGTWTHDGIRLAPGVVYGMYGDGDLPVLRQNPGEGGGFGGGVTTGGNNTLSSIRFEGSSGTALMLVGGNNAVQDCELTEVGMGIGIMSENNLVTRTHIHDLGQMIRDDPDATDVNAVGGAVGIMIMAANNEISHNTIVKCKAIAEADVVGGEDGGATEVVAQSGATITNVYVHHNYAEENVGFFEASSGGGKGTLRDSIFEYNVSVNSKWFFLLQVNNTKFDNVYYQNNTLIYTAASGESASSGGTLVGILYGANESVSSGDVIFQNNIVVMDVNAFSLFSGKGFDHNNNLYSPASLRLGEGVENDPSEIFTDSHELADIAGGDYTLTSGSPAIDAAFAHPGSTTDFDGEKIPAGSARDIGAFEF